MADSGPGAGNVQMSLSNPVITENNKVTEDY